ncbi:MAG: ribonuclease D [Planctomycetes bacterium]|nr:ribonuclease D [Planctomycetota bacterium]MCP4769877.1 ribonuclease D [Planctomycetota bacterium]MCP4859717.1 ribonuclease D [Planctomycetota bacterium]
MEKWRAAGIIGVDTEANSFFAYHERMCLLQVSAEGEDWIVDPIELGDDLKAIVPLLADPSIIKIFHAAEFDLMILKKDLGVEVRGLFDTQVAMTLLRHDKTGLAALIQAYYGIELSKKEQRSNWGKRPLTEEQIAYARIDTHFLVDLHDRLTTELQEADMMGAAEGEFRRQENEILVAGEPDPERYRKMKAARGLDGETLARLKEIFFWRESVAEKRDVPLFRVLANQAMIEMAKIAPTTIKELAEIKGMGWKQAKRYGDELLAAIGSANGKSIEINVPKVSPAERKRRRLLRENLDEMRTWRKEVARELDLPSERLMHRRHLEAICRARPQSSEELNAVVPLNDWQRQNFEASLLAKLEQLPDPDQS